LQKDKNLPIVLTPYFNFFVADALFSNGYSEEAIELIKNYWGAMVKKGAETFWETYVPQTGKESTMFGESLSHGWSSGPAYLLPKWVLGITAVKPVFKEFVFKPCFECVSTAKLTIPVGDKYIKAEFDLLKNQSVFLEYNFPAKATVILPQINYKKLYLDNNLIKPEGKEYKISFDKQGTYTFFYK
jgi:hypothetical protein